jgi:hypothetical protein
MKPGLSAQEARQRLMNNGPNEIPVAKSSGMFRILKEVLREPMFILLLSSATLVTSNLLMVLSKLSMTRSILYSFTSRNKSAKFIFLSAIILMIIVFCVPEISAIFHMTYPGHLDTFYAICAATGFTMCLEFLKVVRRKKKSFVSTQNL